MKINQQLIQDCKKGDRKAQFQLYKSCFNLLMGVCMRYKKDESEAAAVLNVGFLKILNGLKSYKPEVPFEAWIRRIMINTLIDDFRKNRKVKELMEYRDFTETPPKVDAINYGTADKLFDAEELENLIKQLPPVSQKVFNLFAIDGYSHKEIGEMLDISNGTSKWHVAFARKKLQEMMKKTINQSKVS